MRKNLIAGEWRASPQAVENVNPSDTRDIVDLFAEAQPSDVSDAVEAARRALPIWRRTTSAQRFDALDQIGTEIISRRKELGDLLAREEGKTLDEATAETYRAGSLFKYFAAEAYREEGQLFRSIRPNVRLSVLQEPIGVVSAITPWNFPLAIPAWKIAPALAYGNTVVFKPAEQAPASGWMLAEIISRSGLPPGAFNLVMGQGADVGAALVGHKDVAGVSFTGSTSTGQQIGAQLFARGAKCQLEMGGKNALLVLNDADLRTAVDCALSGSFHSAGQRCTASSRLVVESSIHDAFVDELCRATSRLVVGDARKSGTHIGPVIEERQKERQLGYISRAVTDGARVAVGGDSVEVDQPGHFVAPTLLTDVRSNMELARDEIFGPVAGVVRVESYEEGLAVVNDSEFGLSGGIVTSNEMIISHFTTHAEVGMVQVNLPTAGMDFHMPFTGRKCSSYGPPEKGAYARQFFTNAKVVHRADFSQEPTQ